MDAATRRSNLQALIRSRYGDQQVAAAVAFQLSPGRVSQLLDEAQAFGERAARRIEQSAGLPPMWLDRPVAADRADDWTPSQHTPEGVSVRPVAQDLSHPKSEDELPQHTWEFIVSVPASDLPKRFRAAMPDDALAPETPRGLVLHFSTEALPVIGHGVLVQDAAGGRHVRRYAQGLGGAWRAEARNTAYMTLHSGDGVQLLAVVTGRDSGAV